MITWSEILRGRAVLADLPAATQANLHVLYARANELRALYGKPMKVNDGLRIVRGVGVARSRHLTGQAIDIDDTDDGPLWAWTLARLAYVARIGFWIEDPRWTHGNGSWLHFQTVPPASGRRIFVPSSKPPTWDGWDGKYDRSLDA